MKTFRLLLATLSLAALAACGTESITGPGSHAQGARRSLDHVGSDTTTTLSTSTEGSTVCEGTVVVTTDSSGNVTTTCTTSDSKGPVVGSGS